MSTETHPERFAEGLADAKSRLAILVDKAGPRLAGCARPEIDREYEGMSSAEHDAQLRAISHVREVVNDWDDHGCFIIPCETLLFPGSGEVIFPYDETAPLNLPADVVYLYFGEHPKLALDDGGNRHIEGCYLRRLDDESRVELTFVCDEDHCEEMSDIRFCDALRVAGRAACVRLKFGEDDISYLTGNPTITRSPALRYAIKVAKAGAAVTSSADFKRNRAPFLAR